MIMEVMNQQLLFFKFLLEGPRILYYFCFFHIKRSFHFTKALDCFMFERENIFSKIRTCNNRRLLLRSIFCTNLFWMYQNKTYSRLSYITITKAIFYFKSRFFAVSSASSDVVLVIPGSLYFCSTVPPLFWCSRLPRSSWVHLIVPFCAHLGCSFL